MSELRIPDQAMPIVEILRRDVARPTARIVAARVANEYGYVPRFECGKCPLGLHPTALRPNPVSQCFRTDSPLYKLSVMPFYAWWDRLTMEQATEALDLIWPPTTAEEN